MTILGQINKVMTYKDIKREHAICLECGQEITYGRTDKKFCSDTCKNRYHNNNHRDNRSLHHKVMSGIQKNYEILEKLFAMDIRTIDMGDLISLGFRPEFSTGYKKIRSHDEYRCFEYKYNLSSSRLFNLQRIIPYLK